MAGVHHNFTSGKAAAVDTAVVDGPNWDDSHYYVGDSVNVGALIYAGASARLTNLNSVASGQVLTSAGVGTTPAWSASPTLTSVKVGAGTVGAPSVVILDSSNNVDNGLSSPGVDQVGVVTNGASYYKFSESAFTISGGNSLNIAHDSGAIKLGGSLDLIAARDAANVWAQRNGTNAQTFRIYNTYTDASNYERLGIYWSSNTLNIETGNAGTGSARNINFGIGGTTISRFTAAGLIFPTDNTYDIGASGATRPKDIYWAGTAVGVNQTLSNSLTFANRFRLTDGGADGVGILSNTGGTGFTRLIFGTNDASGVAIAKNGTSIDMVLGNDSAYTAMRAATFGVGSTTGVVRAGAGSPEGAVTAGIGSIYMRTDGGAGTSFYVKESGAGNTGWVAK